MVKGAKALELWCSRHTAGYPGVEVKNMSSSWRDGMAFCALVHRFRPEAIDFEKLDRKNIRGNCALAFHLAEVHFGVPSLLDPEDMAACSIPDKLSILTYVSEMYHRFKNLQPKGFPPSASSSSSSSSRHPLKRQDSTDSAGMPLSRTPSDNSSPPSSSASPSSSSPSAACSSGDNSSTGSTCDSPPPKSGPSEEEECTPPPPEPKKRASRKDSEQQNNDNSSVVLRRRRERSLASRRLVQSMYVETGGMLENLVSDAAARSVSPDIERENPFRDAMIKFTTMEQRKREEEKAAAVTAASAKKSSPARKVSVSRSTETEVPVETDSKSTQTKGILKTRHAGSRDAATGPFKTVLNSQLSCPPACSSSRSSSCHNSNNRLSYTSSPKPYSAGQINRSLSMGQSLHKMSLAPAVPDHVDDDLADQQVSSKPSAPVDNHLMTQSFTGVLPSSFSSMNISASNTRPQQPQQQQSQQLPQQQRQSRPPTSHHTRNPSIHKFTPLPHSAPLSMSQSYHQNLHTQSTAATAATRQTPLIWRTSSPYSSNPSLHFQQQQQRQQQQQQLQRHPHHHHQPVSHYKSLPGYHETTLRHVQQAYHHHGQQGAPPQQHSRLGLYQPDSFQGQSSLV